MGCPPGGCRPSGWAVSSMDNVTFRRRNRLRKHFVITSNVLLFAYPHVSDAAKVTYQVIDSFD